VIRQRPYIIMTLTEILLLTYLLTVISVILSLCQVYRARFREENAACKVAKQQRLAEMTDEEKTQQKDVTRKKRQRLKLRRQRKVPLHASSCVIVVVIITIHRFM